MIKAHVTVGLAGLKSSGQVARETEAGEEAAD